MDKDRKHVNNQWRKILVRYSEGPPFRMALLNLTLTPQPNLRNDDPSEWQADTTENG